MLPLNTILHGDCMEAMKDLPDGSIDAIITDPPYGILRHKIETGIDIAPFMQECHRVLKDGGFLAFFGQMPTLLDWANEAQSLFKYRDHISWVKRAITAICQPLLRGHESILIYSKGKNTSKYFTTEGKYSDVKVPGLQFDVVAIEGIKGYIDILHRKIKTGKDHYSGSSKVNDLAHKYVTGNDINNKPRGHELCNFTNVWSFTPQNKLHNDGQAENNITHPTVKPVLLTNRLVELLTAEGMVVLYPFIGSGTTAISCVNMGRDYIGIEIDEEYYDLSVKRVASHLPLLQMAM